MRIRKSASVGVLFILLLFLSAFLLSGCGGASRKTRELRMNVTAPEDSAWMVAAENFQELIEKNTKGRYKIIISPGEEITEGNAEAGVKNLINGGVELSLYSLADAQIFQEKLAVAAMPFLFADYDSVDEILFNGGGKDAIFDLIREMGCEPLGLGENGFRQITNNIRSILSPADLPGLIIRVPHNHFLTELFGQFNADTAVMGWDAAFPLLQSDGVSGQENSLDLIKSRHTYQIQRYLTIWNCSYDPICLSASAAFWEELSESDREIFKNAAGEACQLEVAAIREQNADILDLFTQSGVEVTILTPDELNLFKSRTSPLYAQWRERVGDDLFAAFGVNF